MYINKILHCCSKLITYNKISKNAIFAVTRNSILKQQNEVRITCSRNVYVTSVSNCSLKNLVRYPKGERKFKLRDNVPEEYELVYMATNLHVTACSTFSIVSSAILVGIGFYDFIFGEKDKEFDPVYISENQIFAASWYDFYLCTAVFIFLASATLFITNRFVQRIYRDGDKFIAVYADRLPGMFRKIEFKAGEAKYIPVKYGIVPWSNANFKIKGSRSVLVEDRFKTYSDFKVMLGGRVPGTYYDDIDDED